MKIMDIYKDFLTNIINTTNSYKRDRRDEILNNIILISLKQQLFEYEDDEGESKIIIKQCFGLDQLFKKMYELFLDKKIFISEIESSTNIKEIKERMSKFELLQNICKQEDIFINNKIISSRTILSYSKYDWFNKFSVDQRRKKLLQEINKLNHGDYISNMDSLFSNIQNKVKNIKNKSSVIEEFFNSIRRFKGVFETEGFDFDAYFYNEDTLLFGYIYLKEFESDYGQYDEKTKKFLRKFTNSMNEAIDGFNILSNDWKETYISLKNHKSDKEWVNKYFMIDLSK